MNDIEIYRSADNKIEIQVYLDKETVWLNQYQMAALFDTDRTAILKHIKNIYASGELSGESTCAKIAQVRQEGKRKVAREVLHYNLDLVISVGYRVNSIQGTHFRQWATQRLRDYLVKGYAINEQRLLQAEQRMDELRQAISLLEKVTQTTNLSATETQGLLKVLNDFAVALDLLHRYDHQQLTISQSATTEVFRITYHEAIRAIEELKQTFGGSSLFGKEKDSSFPGSLSAIYQTFDGRDVYPSVEEKAAHLLYFVVKNHSFADGNKRIAAFLFVWFLERNHLLYHGAQKVIDDNALVALTLMIAESNPADKEMMVKVIVNLINNKK